MIKQILKPLTPLFVRKIYRALSNYLKRNWRWIVILIQIRGNSVQDQFKLIISAFYSPFYSFRSLLKWQNPLLLFNTSVFVYGNGKFNVRSKTDDLWHVLPWRESKISTLIKKSMKKGSVFVDAGANIGVYTILASSRIGNTGKVIAIEMIPNTAKQLKTHIAINNCHNVSVIQKALSDKSGEVLKAYIPENKFGMASIEVKHNSDNVTLLEVETATLDEILKSYNHIDLIKMDLEGAELKALQGGLNILKKTKQIIFESHTQELEITKLLIEHGFKVRKLSGRDMLASKI